MARSRTLGPRRIVFRIGALFLVYTYILHLEVLHAGCVEARVGGGGHYVGEGEVAQFVFEGLSFEVEHMIGAVKLAVFHNDVGAVPRPRFRK